MSGCNLPSSSRAISSTKTAKLTESQIKRLSAWIENDIWILFLQRVVENWIGSMIVHTRTASVATRAVLSLG